jgi:F-type H+-transporting ATPase subunit alpha
MEPIKANEINDIIRKQIQNFEAGVTVMEVGTVIKVVMESPRFMDLKR